MTSTFLRTTRSQTQLASSLRKIKAIGDASSKKRKSESPSESETSADMMATSATETRLSNVADLNWYWKDKGSAGVVPFYSKQTKLSCFSNFHEHASIDFTVPESCWQHASFSKTHSQTNKIEYSEKSIMLCKAALMDDVETFDRILNSHSPKETKALGRTVKPWIDQRWHDAVIDVACEVVEQKFSQLPTELKLLKSTGNALIAEAAARDNIWGIGLGVKDPAAHNPRQWKGTNILGYALMEARRKLCPTPLPSSTATSTATSTTTDDAQVTTPNSKSPKHNKRKLLRLQR